jgi:hypothetical protein
MENLDEDDKEIFQEMLSKLELNGQCNSVYHDLAYKLFKDRLGDN